MTGSGLIDQIGNFLTLGLDMKRAAICFLMVSSSAVGADWKVASSGKDVTVLIDQQSIKKHGHLRAAWWMASFTETKTGTHPHVSYRSYKTMDYFSCPHKNIGTLRRIYYDDEYGKGKSHGNYHFEPRVQFKEVTSGSIEDVASQFVCAYPLGGQDAPGS